MDRSADKEKIDNTKEKKDWNGLIYRLRINEEVDYELYQALNQLPVSLRSKRLLALATLGLALAQGDIKVNKRLESEANKAKRKIQPQQFRKKPNKKPIIKEQSEENDRKNYNENRVNNNNKEILIEENKIDPIKLTSSVQQLNEEKITSENTSTNQVKNRLLSSLKNF